MLHPGQDTMDSKPIPGTQGAPSWEYTLGGTDENLIPGLNAIFYSAVCLHLEQMKQTFFTYKIKVLYGFF